MRRRSARRALRSGTTISAACEGVAARASAAKSTSVTSASWPTALTTGTRHAATRPDDGLLVEGGQVVGRAAAAAEDDHVDFGDALQLREGAADRLGGAGPLHLRRRQEDARPAPPERHAADVVDDRPGGARDDADDPRLAGQRSLALGGEEALGGELRLKAHDGREERAPPRRLHPVGHEMPSAARGPGRGQPRRLNARLVDAERRVRGRDRRAVHDDVDRRLLALVLEREVEVAARRRPSAADLALDDDRPSEGALDGPLDGAIELAHRQRPRGLVRRRLRVRRRLLRREVQRQAAVLGHEEDG